MKRRRKKKMLENNQYWRCNGCGENHITPELCKYCGAPHCPACKRTNTLMNVTEFKRQVSHSVEVASQIRKNGRKQNKPRRTSTERLAELMKATE